MNTRPIGIVAGVLSELEAVCSPGAARSTIGGVTIITEAQAGVEVAMAYAGCGKVAATTAAMVLRQQFDVRAFIVTGTAAKLTRQRSASTYLITSALQHDYGAWTLARFWPYRAGRVPLGPTSIGETWFAACAELVAKAGPAMVEAIGDQVPEAAAIVSGDQFVSGPVAEDIHQRTGADLLDMEVAAVAQAAELMQIPWIAAKAISDDARATATADFSRNLEAAAARAAELTRRLIQLI